MLILEFGEFSTNMFDLMQVAVAAGATEDLQPSKQVKRYSHCWGSGDALSKYGQLALRSGSYGATSF